MKSFINNLLGKKEISKTDQETFYPDYESALKQISEASYQDPELCNMIAEKTRIYRDKLTGTRSDMNTTQSFLLSVIQRILIEKQVHTLNVLDLGGACGAHYFEIKRLIPKNASLKWIVIETPAMVKAAKMIKMDTNELSFISDLSHIDLKPHLIHSSSTLQYVEKPYEVIRQLKGLESEWLFFNRMMFNTGSKDLVTIQQSQMADNGPGPIPQGFQNKLIRYPHTNLSYTNFLTAFEPEYKPEWIFDEPSGNINKGEMSFIGKGMLFKKV